MQLTLGDRIGVVGKTAGAIRAYRSAPGNQEAAVMAAVHYARRCNETMVVLAGNSYMRMVYHIARETESIRKYTVSTPKEPIHVVAVRPGGEFFHATAQ